MNISEKAKTYAEGKALEFITKTIEKAYEDGYRQGYADRDSEIPEDLKKEEYDVEYVDLGLPSGTLWAKDYLKRKGSIFTCYLPHCKANEFSLPTLEQWLELNTECHQAKTEKGWCFTGPNGNYIVFEKTGYYSGSEYVPGSTSTHFWMNGSVEGHNEAPSVFIDERNCFIEMAQWTGECYPVRFVK